MSSIKKITRIDDNNQEVSEFYEKIIENVHKLALEKKYKEAIEILEEELSQPYLPNKYYDLFNEKKFEYLSYISDIKYEKKFWTKTPEEILSLINESFVDVYEYWNVFLTKIEDQEIPLIKFHDQIEKIMLSNKIHNFDKMLIIKNLAIDGYNKQINFLNTHTNKKSIISPILIDDLFIQLGYEEAWRILNKKTFKDIVRNNFCLEILKNTFEYYFPFNEFLSLSDMIDSILQYVSIAMDNKMKENDLHPDFYKIERIYLKN